MISYITIGSNDLTAAAVFFNAIFGELNGVQRYKTDKLIGYSFGTGTPMIVVTRPFDAKHASHGNGTMIALSAKDNAQVHSVHALALKLGAKDEGAPGPRGAGFYGGYFRDLDGNKFNICLMS